MSNEESLKKTAHPEGSCAYHENLERIKVHDCGSHHHSALIQETILFHSMRIFLGVVFLFAGYDKILHPQAFAQAVYNYQILPDAAVNLAALVLPWLELLLGMCLLAGFWLPGATVLSSGLLTVFIGALLFNQIRGLDIYCGCFSTETTEGPAGLWIVGRDIIFLAISVYVMLIILLTRPAKIKDLFRKANT
jgi:uncharacterized membrane protein YphA (DoxX/SURF4 family)